jgi:hypothetical protein
LIAVRLFPSPLVQLVIMMMFLAASREVILTTMAFSFRYSSAAGESGAVIVTMFGFLGPFSFGAAGSTVSGGGTAPGDFARMRAAFSSAISILLMLAPSF